LDPDHHWRAKKSLKAEGKTKNQIVLLHLDPEGAPGSLESSPNTSLVRLG